MLVLPLKYHSVQIKQIIKIIREFLPSLEIISPYSLSSPALDMDQPYIINNLQWYTTTDEKVPFHLPHGSGDLSKNGNLP